MKLTKRSLLLLLIAIFLIVAFVLNSARSRQVEERKALNEKLTSAQSRVRAIQLEPLSSRKAELEQQLNQTKSQLDMIKAVLSQPIKKTATTTVLFTTAKAYTVEITNMTLSALTDVTLEKVPASAVSITVTAEGDVAKLIGFITKLNSLFAAGAVQSAIITTPVAGKASADIRLTLYTVQSK